MTEITTSRQGQTLVISFNRPEKMNALTRSMYSGLATGLNEAAGDFGVRAVVLAAAGDHFTAGNDIMDFMNMHICQLLKSFCPSLQHKQKILKYCLIFC